MKTKFKKFLIDNRAYEKFVRNIKNERDMNFDEYCEIDGIWDRVLTSAFYWYRTTEGEKYWNVLNNKWEKLLENDQSTT